ncbi:hypothetical protein F66182_1265 [Fusarium sp. NRRL 66182]|nr:hypothetical protein F66182_1265 [Fusarium sp. NRRL 66182]
MSSHSTIPSPSPPAAAPNSSTTASKPVVNDPARTGFNPEMSWWLNYTKMITGGMTQEGKFHFREWNDTINEESDCKRCEDYRDWVFTYSPVVRFMSEKIQALNGRLDSSNVVCRRCPTTLREDGTIDGRSGGFSPPHGILICANVIRDRKHLEDTLAHEMVHAWDHLRWKVDWTDDKDLKHAACTEIRASMLSGECRWTKEAFTRGNWKLTQQFQNCVRKRAVMSLLGRERCKDDVQAAKVINQVWDSCFSDTRPFDEVYR